MPKDNALYIVATPIGNLGDITLRAIETLRNVDLIAAEDTRHSARLMHHCDITTPLVAYHDHSDDQQVRRIISNLAQGMSVALISDAGTPLISDPGYRLVKQVREAGFNVVPVPGVSAVTTAICASGLASDRFSFEGFPPAKRGARQAVFAKVQQDPRTLVFYESPHRILDSLRDMAQVFGADRQAVLARELTKTYETFLQGSFAELQQKLEDDPNQQRGEMVVLIAGFVEPEGEEIPVEHLNVLAVLLEELSLKQACALAAKLTGQKKNRLYQWALENK